MAPNKTKDFIGVEDLVKAGRKRTTPKQQIGYFEWLLKHGGWRKAAGAFCIITFIGYARSELIAGNKRFQAIEAQKLIENGIKPEAPVNENLFKTNEEYEYGQSVLKGTRSK